MMRNQNMGQTNVPYYSYSARRTQQLAKLSRYKLLIILISRFTYRLISESIQHMHKVTKKQKKLLQRACSHISSSWFYSQKLALQRLKINRVESQLKQNKIKSFTVLLQRILKYKLKKTLSSISLYGLRKNRLMITNVQYFSRTIICRRVQKVFSNKKKIHFVKICEFSQHVKRKLRKLKTAEMISKQYIKNIKQACFNRLTKILNIALPPSSLMVTPKPTPQQSFSQNTHQINQLKLHLSDIAVQLQNKNESISRLQKQIQQLKMQQSQANYNSFSQHTTNMLSKNQVSQRISTKSIRGVNNSKRLLLQGNDSIDSGFQFSLGSILGNSFSILNKSRSREIKRSNKGDSIQSMECVCGYKQKYIKYKNSSQSLKNQLQIVKEQLQVAKDLNDHFTNEIRHYFGGGQQEQKQQMQLERVRKQAQTIKKQNSQLKMKVTKYQHHINILKSEFKLKIQELYRKVKKQR